MSHTGANVAEVLKTATEEWGIANKQIVLVTDNASNMVVGVSWQKVSGRQKGYTT